MKRCETLALRGRPSWAACRGLFAALLTGLTLAGCAGLGGPGLQPGSSTRADLDRVLGAPAMSWPEPGGGQQLAYPRGPEGFQTWMARVDAEGRLVGIENVLDMPHFARIEPGMSQEQVLRILGPSYPGWTVYFKARDELVWEWRFCDVYSEPARFDVLFDGSTGKVRSTMSMTERLSLPWGRGNRRDWCSR